MPSTKPDEPVATVLDEIAERLRSGHASVMIGARFSKSAIQNGPNCKPFLSWRELANIFYQKLHGKTPPTGEHYLNPLKADEVRNDPNALSTIIEVIKWRKVPALAGALTNFKEICQFGFDDWKTHLDDVMFGLDFLIDESDLLSSERQIPEDDRLFIRKCAVALAGTLYRCFEAKKVSPPPTIQNWKDICLSSKEFSDIFNQWWSLND